MIGGYFALLAGVVVFTMMRQKIQSGEDLFLGGRSVGWLAIGASIFAANIGSEHLIGLAGSGAAYGMSLSHLEFHSFIVIMMCWIFVPFYYKSGVSTMPEFLERRFGAKARWILSLLSLAPYVLTKISVTVFAGALFFEVWAASAGAVPPPTGSRASANGAPKRSRMRSETFAAGASL